MDNKDLEKNTVECEAEKESETLETETVEAEAVDTTENLESDTAESVTVEDANSSDCNKEKKDKKDLQIEELTDKYKRTMAEFDNFRKRTEKEKSAMYEIGVKDIIQKMVGQ